MATAMSSSRIEDLKQLQKDIECLFRSRDLPSAVDNQFNLILKELDQSSLAKGKLYEEINKKIGRFGKEAEEILKKLAAILELPKVQEEQGPTSSNRQGAEPSGPAKDEKTNFGKTYTKEPGPKVTKIDVTTEPMSKKEPPQSLSKTLGPNYGSDKAKTNQDVEHWKKLAEDCKQKLDEKQKLAEDRKQELDEKQKDIEKLEKAAQEEKEKLLAEVERKQKIIFDFEKQVNDAYTSEQKAKNELKVTQEVLESTNKRVEELCQQGMQWEDQCQNWFKKSEKLEKKMEQMNYDHENKVRKMSEEIDTLTKSRDDLRDRFSKVAGQKLNDNNPDIADLSDPDRAMKLAERFSAVYDDEWTDAFQEQQDKMKKRETKDIVGNLLGVLKECYKFCEETAKIQLDVLHSVFLHPCQGVELERNATGGQAKHQNKVRIKSKHEKSLKDVRRKIASDLVQEVKDQFLAKMRKDEATDKKAMQCSMPFYEKCVEICWLMVLHDPPLHIDVNVQPGTKMDPGFFTAYQTTGNVIEYLVWPPLYNGVGGGLLSKGTVQSVKKK